MAHSSVDIENLLHERIEKAIDVSPVMNNCFFHAFALYLLINNEQFPRDLFNPHNHDIKPVQDLKEQFTKLEDLALFEIYAQLQNPDCETSAYLFEKILILGVLLRSWFTNWLLDNDEYKKLLYSSDQDVPVFSKIVEFFNESEGDVCSEEALYLANKDFFEGRYDVKPTDDEVLIKGHWLEQGYANYCKYLALPGIKIAPYDIKPVLEHLGISYVIYGKVDKNPVLKFGDGIKQFELAIDSGAGHYFLMLPENNQQLLHDYKTAQSTYMSERENILRAYGFNKLALCQKKSSMLLGATLPPDQLNGRTPISVLVDKIDLIKKFITEKQFVESVLAKDEIIPAERENPLASYGEIEEPQPDSLINVEKPVVSIVKRAECNYTRNIFAIPPLNLKEEEFARQLRALKNKSRKFYLRGFKEAEKEVNELHSKLSDAFDSYCFSTKNKEDYEEFETACCSAIEDTNERGILKKHRDIGPLLKNLVLAVAGFGVLYLGAGFINLIVTKGSDFLFFKNTDTVNKINKIQKIINELENPDSLAGALLKALPVA